MPDALLGQVGPFEHQPVFAQIGRAQVSQRDPSQARREVVPYPLPSHAPVFPTAVEGHVLLQPPLGRLRHGQRFGLKGFLVCQRAEPLLGHFKIVP
jgi:hypothetical protein